MPEISKYSKEELKDLINDGLVSASIMAYKEVVDFVNSQLAFGVGKTQAVANAAQQHSYSENMIWQILRENT